MASVKKREPLIYWIALLALTWNIFLMDGYVKSYGLLYLELLDVFGEGPAKTGLVATIFGLTNIVSAPLSGWLGDRYGTWKLLVIAPVAQAIGCIISAFAPNLQVVYIGYGLILGWANMASFAASTSAVTKLFIYNRTLAMGLFFVGGSFGLILYPFLFRILVVHYTIRGVLLILGGLILNFMVSGMILRVIDKHDKIEPEPEDEEEMKDMTRKDENENIPPPDQQSACRRLWLFFKPFVCLKYIAFFFFYFTYIFGMYGYMMYVPPYSEEVGVTQMQIAVMISVNGVADLLSKLIIGVVTNQTNINIYLLIAGCTITVGMIYILIPTMLLSGNVFPVMLSTVGLVGLCAGGLLGLLGQLVVDAVGTERSGTGIGISGTSFGIGVIIPPIIYGTLREQYGTYLHVPYLSGAAVITSAVCILLGQLPDCLKRTFSSKSQNVSTLNKEIEDNEKATETESPLVEKC